MSLLADALHFKEVDIQIAVAGLLDDIAQYFKNLAWSHPPNEAKHSVQYRIKQKRCGMKTGEPDCIIYLSGARTIFIELKLKGGTVSSAQKARHATLKALGFSVYVVFASTPNEARKKVIAILIENGVGEAAQLA